MAAMTTKTKLEELDAQCERFSILEGNLRCAITENQERQRTMELILLAHGLLEAFPAAGLLRVEMRDGIAVPLRLTTELLHEQVEGHSDFPEVTFALAEPRIIAQGRTLEKADIAGWLLSELLNEISKDSDGTWINSVDASPEIDLDYNDPHYMPKTEFDIDLVKTAALPVPAIGPVTVRADRDDELAGSDDSAMGRLRAGLLQAYPSAYMLYVRFAGGEWSADDLVDETGYGLRSGDPLAAEAIPGGYVSHAITTLAEEGYFQSLSGLGKGEGFRAHKGSTVGILIKASVVG